MSYKIDSFSLYIPISAVLNDLGDFFPQIVVLSDGEIIEEKTGVFEVEKNGIRCSFSIYKNPHRGTFLQTVLSSKLLKEDYFQGLNIKNFSKVLDNLMDISGLVLNKSEVMAKSFINDIDICYDSTFTRHEWAERLKYFNELAGIRRFTKDFSEMERRVLIGVQFVNRRDASISKPFIKFYDKEEELTNKSSEFSSYYLNSITYRNVKRIEVTIKNKSHLDAISKILFKHNPIDNTLTSVLSLSVLDLSKVLQLLLNKHLEFYIPKTRVKKESSQTPQKQLIGALCVMLNRQLGIELEDIYAVINTLDFGKSNNASSRLRATIRDSITDYRERFGVFDFAKEFEDFK